MASKNIELNISTSVINLILKFLIISAIFNGGGIGFVFVSGQFSSLGKIQNYGSSGGSQGSNVVNGSGGGNSNNNGGKSDNSNGNPGSGEVMNPRSLPLIGEPTCEELRAMWRFSKRQSRASEITNEIPTYRDPFTYNVWLPYYPTTRSYANVGPRMIPKYRDPNLPVFGRVVNEPIANQMTRFGSGTMRSLPTIYGDQRTGEYSTQGRRGQFRSGGGPSVGPGSNYLTTHHGKFRELKELVLTERAKELAHQRRNEEIAARAAVLKEIANGQRHFKHNHNYPYSSPFSAENRSPDQEEVNDEEISSKIGTVAAGFAPRTIFSGKTGSNPGRNNAFSNRANSRSMRSSGSESFSSPQGSNVWQRSHFRERARDLVRQADSPTDFYQRDLRSEPMLSSYPAAYLKNSIIYKNINSNPIGDRNTMDSFNSPQMDYIDEINRVESENNKNNLENFMDDSEYPLFEYANLSRRDRLYLQLQKLLNQKSQSRMYELDQTPGLRNLLQKHRKQISKEFLKRLFYNSSEQQKN